MFFFIILPVLDKFSYLNDNLFINFEIQFLIMAGIYIHIPFCKKLCSYCDFYHVILPPDRSDFISAIIKEGLAQFSFWAGRQIDSKSLIADGWHHRSDAIAAALIVIGGLISPYVWWIDGVLGVFISALILKAAYDVFKQTSDMLMGEEVTVHIETKIKEIVCETIGDEYIAHHFHCHNYLKHKEVTFHVYCPKNESLEKVHDKVDKVEKIIREKLMIEATIHPEPMKNYSK